MIYCPKNQVRISFSCPSQFSRPPPLLEVSNKNPGEIGRKRERGTFLLLVSAFVRGIKGEDNGRATVRVQETKTTPIFFHQAHFSTPIFFHFIHHVPPWIHRSILSITYAFEERAPFLHAPVGRAVLLRRTRSLATRAPSKNTVSPRSGVVDRSCVQTRRDFAGQKNNELQLAEIQIC